MKHLLVTTFFILLCTIVIQATDLNPVAESSIQVNDTLRLMDVEEITSQQTKAQIEAKRQNDLHKIMQKNTFLNIGLDWTKMSSEEFPAAAGAFAYEHKNKLGLGLQWGRTFNFHSKPLADILFLGLDFTWLDFNFNKYNEDPVPAKYSDGNSEEHCMPWHKEKTTFDYGMSLGPSVTLYPLVGVKKKGTDNIRMQLYFHVGYGLEAAIIKDGVIENEKTKDGHALGHGLFTSIGANLTWDFIGIGYEFRNDGKLSYKVREDDYDNGSINIKEKTGRLYLQFRF